MDAYHPATVFSSIDHHGRYAFANQPRIALWNLARLAETLLPPLSDDQDNAVQEAQAALGGFAHLFGRAFQGGMRKNLGLFTEQEGDAGLAEDLLKAMAENE